MTKTLKPLSSPKDAILLIVLLIASILGNHYFLQVELGINFVFGSIFMLVILRLFGLGWGLLAAVLSGGYTYFIFNHLIFAFTTILEILVVWYLTQKLNLNLVTSDGFYWIFIVMPLSFLTYSYFLGMSGDSLQLVVAKQVVNGNINVLIANLLVVIIVKYILGSEYFHIAQATLYGSFFNSLISFVLLSSFTVFFLNSYYNLKIMDDNIRTNITNSRDFILNQIENWQQSRLQPLKNITQNFHEKTYSPLELQKNLALISSSYSDYSAMYIGNADGISLAYYPEFDKEGHSNIGRNFSDRDYYKEVKAKRSPWISDVFKGRAGVRGPTVVSTTPIIRNGKFVGYAAGAFQLKYFKEMLEKMVAVDHKFITIVDSKDKVIVSTRKELFAIEPFYYKGNGKKEELGSGYYYMLPDNTEDPLATKLTKATYIAEKKGGFSSWKVIVEAPVEPYMSENRKIYIKQLYLMILLMMVAFVYAHISSRILARPLASLSKESSNLLEKQDMQGEVNWPHSGITEIAQLIANFKAMVERIEASYETVNHQALHDNLTGLANRKLFFDRLEQARLLATRDKKILAIIFVDVDGFKKINDTLGHDVGDQLLIGFSERLSQCIRETDTLCRYGGDEFAIILRNLSHEQDAEILARKIIVKIQEPWTLVERSLKITTSLGIAIYPQDGQDDQVLVKNADLAMYASKARGGDTYTFFKEINNQTNPS